MFTKTRLRWSFIFALCISCILTQRFSAQQNPAPTPGVIRINVNLVQVDAVVTDSKGKPVTNLSAADFEILQDGKSQKIRNFEFVVVKNPLAVSPGRSAPAKPVRGGPVVALPTSSPKPNQVRRTIALVVDDIALSQDSTVHTREAMRKWVDTEMQPGDLVSVVRTNAAMGALQQFTGDKRLLYSAIDRLKYQPGRIGVESFTPIGAEVGFAAELQLAYLHGTINSIRYVMQGLRDLPGRKSLILFAEDLPIPVGNQDVRRMDSEEMFRRLADDANRASVVIYTIDPRGVAYIGPTASDRVGELSGTAFAAVLGQRADTYRDSQGGMVVLAQRTGGLFLVSNDLGNSLSKAVDDGDGYYLMGYQPEDETFAPKKGVAKYHSISVRVKRPGLTVRSRTGFFGLSDSGSPPPVPQTRQAQIAKALVSPFTTADLRVRLTALFSHSDAEGSYIKTLLHFDAHDLTFTEEADGSRSTAVDIAVVTFNENGDPAETVNKTWNLRVEKESYDEVLKKGLVYSVPVPVKKAGPYQLRVALRDATSQKLGSAMQFIDVPDLKNGRLALSGIVVTADPAVPEDPDGTPAVRIFKSGGAFSYAYEILNAPAGTKEKAQLQMQIRLYRDGETVYEGTPSLLNAENDKDATRFAVGGRMQLTKIPPGDYIMQVVVTDSLRKDKNTIAAQTIDFEVR